MTEQTFPAADNQGLDEKGCRPRPAHVRAGTPRRLAQTIAGRPDQARRRPRTGEGRLDHHRFVGRVGVGKVVENLRRRERETGPLGGSSWSTLVQCTIRRGTW